MKLDDDIKNMSFEQRGKALQRARNLVRTHKNKKNNARCWINDLNLYDKLLPEGIEKPGKMDLSLDILLENCKKYIEGQKCKVKKYNGTKKHED